MTFSGFSKAFSGCLVHNFKQDTGVLWGVLSHGMTFSVFSKAGLGCPGHKFKSRFSISSGNSGYFCTI